MCDSYGTPSRGLMQVLPVSFHETDPEYYGRWTGDWHDGDMVASPVDYVARAEAISETVKPRFAEGGLVPGPSPTGRVKAFMTPGEWVMTPEMARASAEETIRRMTGDYYTPEERAAMDEGIRAAFEEEFDSYPEPPTVEPY